MSLEKTEAVKEVKESKPVAKEIDYTITVAGPLYVDPALKKPGFVYAFVSNKPGELEMYQRWGYEVVKDDLKVGQDKPSVSSPLGGSVTVQSKCGQTLVLMAISEELHGKLMAFRASENKKLDAAVGKLDIPGENQYGAVTRDGKKY